MSIDNNMKKQAFTMVEIAIVLTIISLLVGSIVYGRSLLNDSKIRVIIRDFGAYSNAIDNFKDSYSCWPGDCSNATSFFGTIDVNGYAVTNGNGDGIMGSNSTNDAEGLALWQHLSIAGFIKGIYTGVAIAGPASQVVIGRNAPVSDYAPGAATFLSWPVNPWGQYVTPSTSLPNNLVFMSVSASTSGYNIAFVNDAAIIDVKMDDGMPYTGSLISFGGMASPTDGQCVTKHLFNAGLHNQQYLVNSNTQCIIMLALQGYIYR
jgi:prepilin-type N-terminal cleavage/methylation domain-containing protein